MKKKYGTHDFNDIVEIANEFKGESDRATVILAAAKMDAMLYLLIGKFLIPITTSQDELLDGDSPLGTFSSRINIAYRLGLISPDFVKALHIVRRIRNSFAHEVRGGSLKTGGHSDRIRELLIPFQNLIVFQEWRKALFEDKEGLDIDFRLICTMIIYRLDASIHFTSPIKVGDYTYLIPTDWKEEVPDDKTT